MNTLAQTLFGSATPLYMAAIVHAGGPAPPNDACGSAAVIPGNTVTFNPPLLDTTGAGSEILCAAVAESCEVAAAGVSNTVWYSYTPNLSGSIRVDTFGSNYNTVLSVFDGCGTGFFPNCNVPDQLACNDDFPFGTTSQVTLDVVAGQTYIIKVADYNTTDGGGLLDFNLRWIPPNDVCDNATLVTSTNYNPPPYATNHAATDLCENAETCEVNNVGVSNSVWYLYIACADGTIDINTNGSNYDTVLSIWDKCGFFFAVDFPCNFGAPPPAELDCDDDSGLGTNSQILGFPVIAGQAYVIKVSDYNMANGGGMLDFNLTFDSGVCPTDLNGDGMVDGADLGQVLLDWGACR